MSTHNLCFEQKHKKYKSFLSENFQFLEVKFSIYLNRRVFVMMIHPCYFYSERYYVLLCDFSLTDGYTLLHVVDFRYLDFVYHE